MRRISRRGARRITTFNDQESRVHSNLYHTLRLLFSLAPTIPASRLRGQRRWCYRSCLRSLEHRAMAQVNARTVKHCDVLTLHLPRDHDNVDPKGNPLDPNKLITLHYHRNSQGQIHDPVSFKTFRYSNLIFNPDLTVIRPTVNTRM